MISKDESQTRKDKLNAAALAFAQQRMQLDPNDKIGLIRLRAESEEWGVAVRLAMSFVREYGGNHYFYKLQLSDSKRDYVKIIMDTLDIYVPKKGATYFSLFNRAIHNLHADYGREIEKRNEHIVRESMDELLQFLGEDSADGAAFDGSDDRTDMNEMAAGTEQEDEAENAAEITGEESDQEISPVSVCKELLSYEDDCDKDKDKDKEAEAVFHFFNGFVRFCRILEDKADLVKGVKNYQNQKHKYRVFSTRDYLRIMQLYFPADTIANDFDARLAAYVASYDHILIRIFSQPYIVFLRANAQCVVNEATAKEFIARNGIGTINLSRFRRWIAQGKIPESKYITDKVIYQFLQRSNLSEEVQFYRRLAYLVFEASDVDKNKGKSQTSD